MLHFYIPVAYKFKVQGRYIRSPESIAVFVQRLGNVSFRATQTNEKSCFNFGKGGGGGQCATCFGKFQLSHLPVLFF